MGKLMPVGAAAVLVLMLGAPAGAAPAGPDQADVASVAAARERIATATGLPARPSGAHAAGATGGGPSGGATALGAGHTCTVVLYAGVWCWGANDDGQLGDGTTTDATGPVLISRSGGLRDKAVLGLVAGRAHTCALVFGGEA